jgi:hypothetical protein
MNTLRGRTAWTAALCLAPLAASAATKTELAGNPLAAYPFFEYVRAFNVNAPVNVAIDPTRFPAITGDTCNIYVVAHKSPAQWAANTTLTDVTPGGFQTQTFTGTDIQGNTVVVAAASTLDANAGIGLGVGHDVVLDCDQNGSLSAPDFIDGLADEAGLYMVHDTTAPGPEPVTHVPTYAIAAAVATTFGIPAGRRNEDLFFPTNIAAMGRLPIIIIGHGNGHSFDWYAHIGNHMASYGYIVMSHDNDTGPGPASAALTTLGHTQAFIDQAEAGAIAGGQLVGHLDTHRITWIGHSRGAEGVAIAYDTLFDGMLPANFTRKDIRFISSMLPTDFGGGTDVANPHDANFHLWTASGDSDVSGHAWKDCCQTFRIFERATSYRQSTVVQGTGHGWFHDGTGGAAFSGECSIGEANTHLVQLGMLLPLIKHYVEGNIPALDFITRQYESFRPIGVPSDAAEPCMVVSSEYRNGADGASLMIDDYQTETATNRSSSGGSVTFDVDNVLEGQMDDNNSDFAWTASDPFNGAVRALATDTTRAVVFDWTGANRFYEWGVPAGINDFSRYQYLSLRGAQGTQHPNTLAATGDLAFDVTLRDGAGATSTIRSSAFGGGFEEPYAREGGFFDELETVRFRLTDFKNNGNALNLANIVAVRLDLGPAHGANEGRIVLDELMLTNYVAPHSFAILEPTTSRPSYAGTSLVGNRVLVRLFVGAGLAASPADISFAVDGVTLTPAQIPTPPSVVSGETWAIISAGPKPDGCYDLTVSLAGAGLSDSETSSLCFADDESRELDRVLAIDKTNSMLRDGVTNLASDAKMQAARAAAKFFVDLSNPNDQIGVVSFQRRDQDGNGSVTDPDELAEPEFALVLAGEGGTDQRGNARNAIDAVAPDTSPGFTGPETSPGAGLVEARTMITNGALAGHEPNIVLLTDGLENYAPFWTQAGPGGPLRPDFEAGDVRVDTVGVGADADDALLIDVAGATGGEFRNFNEGSGSFFLLSRLADFYKTVDEDVRGEQRFYYAEGFPTAQVPIHDKPWRIGAFEVEPALDWMTVAFHANLDNAYEVQLFPPGAASPIVVTPPGVTLRHDSKHDVYRVRTPAAGTWHYFVNVKRKDAEFFVVASALTALTAKLGPNQLTHRPNDFLMPLRLWIADRHSVTGATVTGYVRRPDGVKTPVTLLDNGISMDGAANDGIYGVGFVATLPGAYFVNLHAAGSSSIGIPFTRYATTGFAIPGAKKRPDEGTPTGPVRCACERATRLSAAAYGGRTFPHGSFDTAADSGSSFGFKVAQHFNGFGGRASLGLYFGRDNFGNPAGGSDF